MFHRFSAGFIQIYWKFLENALIIFIKFVDNSTQIIFLIMKNKPREKLSDEYLSFKV